MSRLTDLLRTVSQLDPQLAKDLEDEIEPLQKRLPFGLNFERHAPEAVELPGHKIRKMSKVRVLPPRGTTERGDHRIWTVAAINGDMAEISTPSGADVETASMPLDELVLVAEFRDRIYPGLRPDGIVERGGDKPFHTVINGENFHVLEQLTFTHEKSVDAIYIDPPYNSGARDWKYNNDYVEDDDLYRHSKWLAFMERRLKLAKRLMKPDDSVLVVTIDEKEYLRLGLLLEQTFPQGRIQMISSVINPTGAIRTNEFTRTNEFIYYVLIGGAELQADITDIREGEEIRWNQLRRFEMSSARNGPQPRPDQFYPIYVDVASGRVAEVGNSIALGVDRHSVPDRPGCATLWPLKPDGTEMIWGLTPVSLRSRLSQGFVRVTRGKAKDDQFSISYLTSGKVGSVGDGSIQVVGHREDGSVIVERVGGVKRVMPTTQWQRESHSAQGYGTKLLSQIIPNRRFPFPKSLYAVEDVLRFVVGAKPDAVVLDFFSGSGTTAHAVMRLNRQDGGRRQCISVTNNEVSADEQVKLRKRGLRPGDPEWEKLGICDFITKPRIQAAITGRTLDSEPIKGDYKFVDEFPMSDGFEESAAFFTLTYESKWLVGVDRAFAAIAPMLWLRAGAIGSRIDSIEGGWAIADSYGILRDLDDSAAFAEALRGRSGIRVAYIVTDDEGRYQQVANEIRGVETVRLYEDYLRNCEMKGDF